MPFSLHVEGRKRADGAECHEGEICDERAGRNDAGRGLESRGEEDRAKVRYENVRLVREWH